MKALLLIAHGSRREESNQEVRLLAQTLKDSTRESVDIVVPAFLELAQPSIAAGIDCCVRSGATQVIAVPYFLAAGRHVVADIPSELKEARQKYPGLDIVQTQYLGQHSAIGQLLLGLVRECETRKESSVIQVIEELQYESFT